MCLDRIELAERKQRRGPLRIVRRERRSMLELSPRSDEGAATQRRLAGRKQRRVRATNQVGVRLAVADRLPVVIRGELGRLTFPIGRDLCDPLRHLSM